LSEEKLVRSLKSSGVDPMTRLKSALLALGTYDFVEKMVLEREVGHKRAKELRAKIWSAFFQESAERYRKQLGTDEVDIPTLGLIMKRLQEENFSVVYEIEENTPERHVGYMRTCPLWGDEFSLMRDAFGDRLRKDLFTPDNVYDISQIEVGSIIKKFKLAGRVSALLDNCVCLGGDPKLGCRIIFERKKR